MKISKRKLNDWLLSQAGVLWISCEGEDRTFSMGADNSNKGCFGRKKIYSGNLEILPGIGKPGKFFGKYEIFSGNLTCYQTIYMHSDMHPVYVLYFMYFDT